MFLNNKKIAIISIIVWFLAAGLLYRKAQEEIVFDTDLVEINRIYQEVQKNWGHLEELSKESFLYPFTVVDQKKIILYETTHVSEEMTCVEDAMRNHNTYYFIMDQNQEIGTLLIQTNDSTQWKKDKWELAYLMIGIVTILLFGMNLLIYYLQKNVIYPFERMKETARNIAAGNFDVPLEMDKSHIFGAFTESFDILREELKIAKEKEYQANESKKELVASLSHDIKTPVTSIKLISEVMIAKRPGVEIVQKFMSINQKAEQIDALISNMFHATMEELGELKVACRDENSKILQEIVKNADYNEKVTIFTQEESCLISIDKLRLEQVIGNIINNSYKYANTPIEVTCKIEDNFMRMQIRDFGSGVQEEELPLIFQKYYRSKEETVRKQAGAGLGLYICSYLMQKMGGSIQGRNVRGGFVIELMIALSE